MTADQSASKSDDKTSGFSATSDSMQNLLAQHFTRAPAEANFSTPATPSVGARLSETRAVETLAALMRKIESGPLGMAGSNEAEWPPIARRAVAALREENMHLRATIADLEARFLDASALADRDVLTPTLNRRAFLKEVQRAMADCRRYGEQACLLFLDLDSFKAINDTWGHAAGDAALLHVADVLLASVREGDSVGRMGGDEFSVLLRHADLQASRIKALKLEDELSRSGFDYQGQHLKIGGSFGVRAYADQASAEAWIAEADASMFLVKKSSR